MGVLAPSGVFRERVPLRSVLQKGSNLLCIERKEIVKGTDKGEKYKHRLKRKFGAFGGGGIFLIWSGGFFQMGGHWKFFPIFPKMFYFCSIPKIGNFFQFFTNPLRTPMQKWESFFAKNVNLRIQKNV